MNKNNINIKTVRDMISDYCRTHTESEVGNVIVRGFIRDNIEGEKKLYDIYKDPVFDKLSKADKAILKELFVLANKELATIHNQSVYISYRNIFIAAVYERFGVS